MNSRLLKVSCIAVSMLAISALGQRPAGAVVIDAFESGDQALSYTGDLGSDEGTGAGPGIMGTEREVSIRDYGFFPDGAASVDIQGGFMEYEVTDGALADVEFFMIWDGAGDVTGDVTTAGLGSQDLTQGGGTAFHFQGVSATHATHLWVAVYSGNGANFAEALVVVPAGTSNGNIQVPFSSFTGVVDFTDIGAVRLHIDIANPVSEPFGIQIEEINTTGDAVPVDKMTWGAIKAVYR